MSDSFKSGAFLFIIWIATVLISIGSGILAWNWIEPENFWGGVGFLITWGLLSTVGYFIAMGLISLFSSSD